MQSLFIVSLPRSLSTQVYRTACAALDLQSPRWTSDGEILNADRAALLGGSTGGGLKYTTPRQALGFAPAQDFLSDVVRADGFAYKDVVQPFIVSRWLREHPTTRVLKIVPNLAHVAFAMLARRWLFPTTVAIDGTCLEERMMSGLLQASAALEAVPGEQVAYDDLLDGFGSLREALSRLYPGKAVDALPVDADFETGRAAVLNRRASPLFQSLQTTERRMREARAA